jgi:DNA (cytosine-5)-methyltransferase 1
VKAVELFAGAGGLALGVSQAGFDHLALIELDPNACETIRANQALGHPIASRWPLHESDVRDFDYSTISGAGEVDLLTAGLPCQPFSVAGKGRAHRDKRDMFSELVRAARELKPRAILIENVKGLVRSTFKDYFDYLLLAIAAAGFARAPEEGWREHFECLKRHRDEGTLKEPRYKVEVHTVNAADYGVPQWRERVFIVAFRADLDVSWTLPPPTHSLDALIWSQWKTGAYWKRFGLRRERPGLMTQRVARRVKAIRELERLEDDTRAPWKTVREAFLGLPKLRQGQRSEDDLDHYLNPGARAYKRHRGSLMDEPAKTLKAGSHGVPGGENTLSLGGSHVRYFSVRECARLQTFPDDYHFSGAWSRAMRQVGNAVPVLLAKILAEAIRDQLERLDQANDQGRKVLPFVRASA